MVFMETMLDGRFNPLSALWKKGTLKGFANKFNADAELLDDLVRANIIRTLPKDT